MPTPAKAHISATSMPAGFDVLFNPNEYTIRRGVTYAEIAVPGLDQPILQFVRGDADTFSCELFLDSSETPNQGTPGTLDVPGKLALSAVVSAADMLRALQSFTVVQSDQHAPPIVTFSWGGDASFVGVITSLTQRFVLFDQDGVPWRIRVTLEMKRFQGPDEQRKRADLRSPDRTKTWVVREGDTLSSIAFKTYGDARLWRTIAEENQLERPRDLVPGQVLRIKAL